MMEEASSQAAEHIIRNIGILGIGLNEKMMRLLYYGVVGAVG